MIFWQYQKGHMPGPDKLKQHTGRLHRPTFRCGNNNEITRAHTLAIFSLERFNAQGEPVPDDPGKQKRFFSANQEQIVSQGNVHISATSSDWQLGHIGRLPIPLNRSPHSLQR